MLRVSCVAVVLLGFCLGMKPLSPHNSKQYYQEETRQLGDPLLLTPYIDSGDVETGRNMARVTEPLPDIGNAIDEHYAGYITTDRVNDGNIFFWFFPATEDLPEDAPVVVWLQGGPGSSSMFGLFEIHGPINVTVVDGQTTGTLNPYSWTRRANMLYVDQPVGTGYSYVDRDGLLTNIDQCGEAMYDFLVQFFTLFPMYKPNDFYLFGESYAGKFVPEIGVKIDQENEFATETFINLKGVGIGDGFMSPPDTAVHGEYLYQLSLVNEQQRDELIEMENNIKRFVDTGDLYSAYLEWSREQGSYVGYMGCGNVYDAVMCSTDPEEDDYEEYIQRPETRAAIHVGKQPFGREGGLVFSAMSSDFMAYGQDNVEYLLDRYKVLIYDGQFDIICDHTGILQMFAKMETWSAIDEYRRSDRTTFFSNQEVAGYVTAVQNLRMFVMRNAGHMVPRSQPMYAFDMFEQFLAGTL